MRPNAQERIDLQRRTIDVLTAVVSASLQVEAAWLGGSWGSGTADAFSDLDLYIAVRDEMTVEERADLAHELLAVVDPVFVAPIAGLGTAFAAKTEAWLHIDLLIIDISMVAKQPMRQVRPLVDRQKALVISDDGSSGKRHPYFPVQVVQRFFYLVGNLITHAGRDEPLLARSEFSELRDEVLVPLLLAENGYRGPRRKRLRALLSDEQQSILLAAPSPTPDWPGLVEAYLVTASVFIRRGRALAEQTGDEWPAAVEDALRGYLRRSLGLEIAP